MNEQIEKAILVGVQLQETSDEEMKTSLDELADLAKAAGIEAVDSVVQRKARQDRNNYLGKGKMSEIGKRAQELGAKLIIVDDELSSLQHRRMEEGLQTPVTDRTSLILEIFASRASSREGKLQVELARLQYRLMRLAGGYEGLSRQRGGIGTKGPGETKIESDRRALRDRVKDLNDELEKVVQERHLQRKKRTERYAPLFSLVGYTNAGKSTLLNALSGSQVLVRDGLFSTLDPTARRIDFSGGRAAIVSDTVGFIKKLPHSLIRAFRATLEDVVNSQALIIVNDFSNPLVREHLISVREVLEEIGAWKDRDHVVVFNKIDRPTSNNRENFSHEFPEAAFISAQTGEGLDYLRERLEKIISAQFERVNLLLPNRSPLLKEIFHVGILISQEWRESGVEVTAEIPKKYLSIFQPYHR